jgi:hypothetical protein
MKIGHGSNSGIKGLRNLRIEGILSIHHFMRSERWEIWTNIGHRASKAFQLTPDSPSHIFKFLFKGNDEADP